MKRKSKKLTIKRKKINKKSIKRKQTKKKNPLPFTEKAKFEKLRKEAQKIGIYTFKAPDPVFGYYYVDQKGKYSSLLNIKELESAINLETNIYEQMKPWGWR